MPKNRKDVGNLNRSNLREWPQHWVSVWNLTRLIMFDPPSTSTFHRNADKIRFAFFRFVLSMLIEIVIQENLRESHNMQRRLNHGRAQRRSQKTRWRYCLMCSTQTRLLHAVISDLLCYVGGKSAKNIKRLVRLVLIQIFNLCNLCNPVHSDPLFFSEFHSATEKSQRAKVFLRAGPSTLPAVLKVKAATSSLSR